MPKKSPTQLYHKLFYRYTIIIICIVSALVVYFISATRVRIVETNLDYMKMMEEEAVKYLTESEKTAGYIHADLYQSGRILDDLIQYYKLDEEAYQRYRLDTYAKSSSLIYEGFEDFMERSMKNYPNITSIELIAYDKGTQTQCYPNGRMYESTNTQERKNAIEAGDLAGWQEFAFLKEIRNPATMQSEGCMIIHFNGSGFAQIQDYYNKADLIVCNMSDTLVYAPEERGGQQADLGEIQGTVKRNYVNQTDVAGYRVYAGLSYQTAAYMKPTLFLTILAVGGLMIILGMVLVHMHLKRLTQRLHYILDGMQRVMTGDLQVRLATGQEQDELDVISENFNEMCIQLDRYIQKSYLAEIEQKNAEMDALQSQINPHFLYNTLESIRMKAICNGDREVGKMLYSLAVIFRSQVKDADVITVIQELHYCKKYLELFEYRYQGKFTSRVECPEELMNYRIIKFILQPVIENYFVHGIRAETQGNEIIIRVEKEEKALFIHVIDNGRGIEEDALREKNKQLQENRMENSRASGGQSIGLTNVNRRIKAVYGEEYGVVLNRSETGGMHITLKVGLEKEQVG